MCHTGNGKSVKIPTECWETIEKYINDYSPMEICCAADESDREYYMEIFERLIDSKLLVLPQEEHLQIVDLSITCRCNLSCKHCCEPSQSVDGEDPLSTDEWKYIIDKIIKAGVQYVTITGGEPMVRTDFTELTRFLKEKDSIYKGLMTNGTLIDESNVDAIVNTYSDISISLDGYDEDTCSKLRGPGIFAIVIRSIELLKKRGFPAKRISVSMVETAYTQGKREYFENLCKELNVNSVIRTFSESGRGEMNAAEIKLRETESIYVKTQRNRGLMDIIKRMPRSVCQNCSAGRTKLAINYKGDIFPCMPLENSKYCLGNILTEDSIEQILRSRDNSGQKNFHHLLIRGRSRCAECDVAPFCMYCLDDFEREVQRVGIDAICKMKKGYLSEIIWGS